MEKQLNVLLSDLVVFYHKLQSYHWYVKGPDFFQAHAKLEDYYNEINGHIDEVAEAVLMSDMKPVSKLSEFTSLTKIKEASGTYVDTKAIFREILKDFQYLLKSAESLKAAADKANNYLVSVKMDDLIEDYRKAVWMISQRQM